MLGCRSANEGRDTAAKLVADGSDARALLVHLGQPSSVTAALAELAEAEIAVDVLVNNAGIYRRGTSLDVAIADMRESFEIHFFGPLALCQALIPGMARRGYGRVVNVSSGYGALSAGLPGDAAYSLSKAALNALTLRLSKEVGRGVKVNAACPGWVRTRMGGPEAPRSVEDGAATFVWLATLPASGPNGEFLRDGELLSW